MNSSPKNRKSALSPEQLAEAAKLKAIWLQKKPMLGLTQESAAERLGITQTGVSHYLNGSNPLNLKVAVVFAEMLGVTVGDFSPTLEDERKQLALNPVIPSSETSPHFERLLQEVTDFSKSEMAELLAQVDLIKRRKRGDL